MNNYWLSEHYENDSEDPEDTTDSNNNDPHSEIKDKLNDRQLSLYEHYESIVEDFGLFDKSAKANGSHYTPADSNPFISEGLICGNCAFYIDGGCEIVKGNIESEGICKLWIIPGELITIKK